MTDVNIQTYSNSSVVDHYEKAEGLMPPERVLFSKYAKGGMDILDIGVGGGRTTPFLAEKASRYLGLDYATAMVEACKPPMLRSFVNGLAASRDRPMEDDIVEKASAAGGRLTATARSSQVAAAATSPGRAGFGARPP